MIFISNDPKGKVYHDLIDLAFKCCDEFVLVLRKDIDISNNARTVIEGLSSSLKEIKEQFEWPGTRCFGKEPALVYYFQTDKFANKVLKEVSNSLQTWIQPDLPEDLSFKKGKGLWLINTSHEKESYLVTEDKEDIDKFLKIEDLQIRYQRT